MKRLSEAGIIQYALLVALVLSVGMITGLMTLSFAAASSGFDPSEARGAGAADIEIWLAVVGTLLNPRTLLLVLVAAAIGAFYIASAARRGHLRIAPFAIASGFLYAAAAAMILPLIPIRGMVLLAVGAALFYRPESGERWSGFWTLLVVCVLFTALGTVVAPLLGDDVRPQIPWRLQLFGHGVTSYLIAFATVFCLKRLRWGLKEYESFYMVILVGSVFISFEALITFYLKQPDVFAAFGPSMHKTNMFRSAFIQDHHKVARLAMTGLFMSLYFFRQRAQNRYLCSAILAALLLGATLNRAPFVATVIGVTAYLVIGVQWADATWTGVAMRRLVATSAAVVILVGGGVLLGGMEETRDTASSLNALENRMLHGARAVEVLRYTPLLGTGPGNDTYYLGSGHIPPVLLLTLARWFQVSEFYALQKVARSELYGSQGDVRGRGAHSLVLEILMHWGVVVGGAALLYLLFQALRAVRRLILAESGVDKEMAWLVLLFAMSLCLSVFTTSGFRHYWFFAITFYFVSANMRRVGAERLEGGEKALSPGRV